MKKALIIGGSGGLSGRLATLAKEEYEVWALTRGRRKLPPGVNHIMADRDDEEAFAQAIENVGIIWDVIFDCICMNENHGLQDLKVLSKVSKRLVVISTDSVYDFRYKKIPQRERGFLWRRKETRKCAAMRETSGRWSVFFCNILKRKVQI